MTLSDEKARKFARALINYAEQRVDKMFDRLQAEWDEPGVYYIETFPPATERDEAKHAAIMSMNVKPKGVKPFSEWRAEQGA